MDDLALRVALVGGVIIAVATMTAVLRTKDRHPARIIDSPGLDPGIYFFSSAGCSTCSSARAKLDRALGEHGYTEMLWETQPGVFSELGIDEVPAVVLVSESGPARFFPGQPESALAAR